MPARVACFLSSKEDVDDNIVTQPYPELWSTLGRTRTPSQRLGSKSIHGVDKWSNGEESS